MAPDTSLRDLRVAYVVGWPGGPETGPFQKIKTQVRHWSELGADVAVFALTTPEHLASWRSIPEVAHAIARARNPIRLAVQKEQLLRRALRGRPDVVYHRYSLAYPGLVRAASRVPVVLEVNTDDVREYRLIAPRKAALNERTRGLVLRRVAGLVAVTHELAESDSFSRFRKPTTVIANGISLSHMPLLPAPRSSQPTLVFLGQPHCPWHGVDKLVRLARRRPTWRFDVIGPGQAEMREECGEIPANVSVHGSLAPGEYAAILARAHVGVGSLALHRKSMDEASTLKLREYLATGLPSIVGYRDTDFPHGAPFLLELPNSEDNVERCLPDIDRFVATQSGRRVSRSDVAHLDSLDKERRRLEFLAGVAVPRRAASGAPPV